MDALWQQIKRLRSDMWIEKHIVRPYLAFDSVLCEALQHNLPQMVPPPHHPSTSYPLPKVIFRMFDYTDCPDVSFYYKSHPEARAPFLSVLNLFVSMLYNLGQTGQTLGRVFNSSLGRVCMCIHNKMA
jgi:hypothetical protein